MLPHNAFSPVVNLSSRFVGPAIGFCPIALKHPVTGGEVCGRDPFLKALSWRDKGDGQSLLPPDALWPEFSPGDELDSANHEPRTVREIVAEAHLLAGVPKRIKRKLAHGEPVVVVIETLSPEWSEALADAARVVWKTHVVTEEANKLERLKTLKTEGAIIAIASDCEKISSRIVASSDVTIRIVPNAKAVARAIGLVCGARARLRQEDVEGLEPDDLAFAIRRGMAPKVCVTRLRQLSKRGPAVADANSPAAKRPAPNLDQLVGYGSALDEVRVVAEDIIRFKDGAIMAYELPSLLFYGPPGTGKTTLVRSFAQSVGLPLHVTSVSAWFQSGDGALGGVSKNAKKFFDEVAAGAPCIAFLDELDALPDRASLDARGRDWWTPVITGILLLVDKVRAEGKGVVLCAATNHIEHIDAALKRAGRFDRHIQILGPQSPEELADVLRRHLGEDLLDVDLLPIARLGHGGTGATAEGWVKAARRAARSAGRPMVSGDLAAAIAPADGRSPAELRLTALHEAGHAVIARALGLKVPVVTIVSEDDAGGVTSIEGLNGALSRSAIEARVVAILAGRAADETLSTGPTTGAAMDLAQATSILTSLHSVFGLGDRLTSIGIDASGSQALALDARLRVVVEHELQSLMDEARRLVGRYEKAIRSLAELLLEQRVAGMAEIDAILEVTPEVPPSFDASRPVASDAAAGIGACDPEAP